VETAFGASAFLSFAGALLVLRLRRWITVRTRCHSVLECYVTASCAFQNRRCASATNRLIASRSTSSGSGELT
jgi:hypothetical protein